MWKLAIAVPQMALEGHMVVVDAGVEDGDDDILAGIAQIPHLVSLDL